MYTRVKNANIVSTIKRYMKMDILTSIQHTLNSISGNTVLGKIGVAVGSAAAAYFTPIIGLLITCLAATAVDMCYGMRVARKFGKKLTSKKNWRGTLCKIKDEFILISLSHLLEHTAGAAIGIDELFVLSGGVTIIITLTEIWSIIENLNTLDPDGPWKVLGKFLKKKGEDIVGIDLDVNNNKHDDYDNTQCSQQPEEDVVI